MIRTIAIASTVEVLGHGGVEVVVRALLKELGRSISIHLISPDSLEDLEASGLMNSLTSHLKFSAHDSPSELNERLIAYLRSHSVELCNFHLCGSYGWGSGRLRSSPIVAVRNAGIRCVTTNHQINPPFGVGRAEVPLLRKLASFAKRWPGKIRQLNSVYREILVSKHDLLVAEKIFPFHHSTFEVIYHSCLQDTDAPPALPRSCRILNLGTICFHKGQHILTRAFAAVADQHPQWELRLVGRVAEEACAEMIMDIAQGAGIEDRVSLPGPTNSPAEEILGAEIYVQPSLLEALGLSLQEAMAAGRACIGSRVGGIPELIEHESSGILFEAGNADELAGLLRTLIADRSLREAHGRRSHAKIQEGEMTMQAMAGKYRELYERAIKA